MVKTIGTYEQAVERAVRFGNRRRRDRLAAASRFLKRCGWNDFGVEYAAVEDLELAYLNQGDTYDLTVCQEGNGKLFSSSWGDWFESEEQKHELETNTIRCGYCGHFTPEDPEREWNETVCESCGHHVDGSK